MARLVTVASIAAGIVCAPGLDAFANWSIGREKPESAHYEEAIRYYTLVIESGEVSKENLGNAFYNRANAFSALGKHVKAIQDYSSALRFNPGSADTYYNRGNSHATLGDHDQAIRDYSQAIRLRPNHDLAYYNRGNSYLFNGDYVRAIEDYKKAYSLNPDDPGHQENMRDLGLLD